MRVEHHFMARPTEDSSRPERRRSTKRHAPTFERGDDYDRRWEELAEHGADIHGEANLVEALLRERGGRRVLDAGCGTGRVAIELAKRGYETLGVDIDPTMLDTARRKARDLRWVLSDLARLSLDDRFDLVMLAGNVVVFVGPGNEREVLRRMADHLVPGGLLVAGVQLGISRYLLSEYDRDAGAAGLRFVDRFATWEGAPYEGGDYAVSIHEKTAS
jgi:SAM-dependent methyltransferase